MSNQNEQADLKQLRGRVADLETQNQKLLAALEAGDKELSLLRAALSAAKQPGPKPLGKPKDGHRWVYAKYQVVVEHFEGQKFKPQIVPAGEPLQVSVNEFQIDGMRRYPHFETAEDHDRRIEEQQKKRAIPVQDQMAHLAGIYEQAEQVAQLREQRRQATLQDITDAQRIASQLPE